MSKFKIQFYYYCKIKRLEWKYVKPDKICVYHLGINFFCSQRDPNSIIVQFQRKIFILFKALRQNKFPFFNSFGKCL